MAPQTLQRWVEEHDDIVDTLRQQGRAANPWSYQYIPPAYTNWIEEQQALQESCALGNLSHHMVAVELEGPDSLEFLKELCVNNFDNYEVGKGKQIIMCSPDGYVIGDGPLLRLSDETFYSAGIFGTKWMKYKAETMEYDISIDIEPPSRLLPDNTPERFVFQVQGPKTYEILDKLTDDEFRHIDFFSFDEITIAGQSIIAFGHGMSTEPGFELIGPYEYAEEIRDAFSEAGEEYGFRLLGTGAYYSQAIKSGWIPPFIKPVYHSEAMRGYREWVDGEKERNYGKSYWSEEDTLEMTMSLEGSFDSNDIRDYYFKPVELGYGPLIDLDRDFIGRDAVEEEVTDPRRVRVTLFWDDEDVERINNSMHGEGDHYQFMAGQYPAINWARAPYDQVLKDGEPIGISLYRAFKWDIRGVASNCIISPEYSDPGTEVTVIWGQPGGKSPIPSIEDHVQTEVRATVRPAPYSPKEK